MKSLIALAVLLGALAGCTTPTPAPTAAQLVDQYNGAPLDTWTPEDRAAYMAAVHAPRP